MTCLPLAFYHNYASKRHAWLAQLIVRSFSPLASAFWHSGHRYSNSDLVSESTSLWIIRAYRKRVALLHLAQVTYVSEMAVSRVPRTSSCMTGPCLSFLFQESRTMVKAWHLPTRTPTGLHTLNEVSRVPKWNLYDYGMRAIKMQVSLTIPPDCATMFLY